MGTLAFNDAIALLLTVSSLKATCKQYLVFKTISRRAIFRKSFIGNFSTNLNLDAKKCGLRFCYLNKLLTIKPI